MSWLLAICAVGVGAMLVAINYPGLSDYAESRIGFSQYAAVAGAEPVFGPRIVEPLVEPIDVRSEIGHPWGYPYGYSAAEHNPEDDSVTLTFEYPELVWDVNHGMFRAPHNITSVDLHEAMEYSQTFLPGQTFAYSCLEHGGGTEVRIYQYMGTSVLQGVRSLVLADVVAEVPEDLPCRFPDYIRYTTDVYDMGGPGPDRYELPGSTVHDSADYADHVGRASIVTQVFVDPWPPAHDPDQQIGRIDDFAYLPDGSIDVTFSDADDPGRMYSDRYRPGQTFVNGCWEHGDFTYLTIYNYRGTEELGGSEYVIFVTFGAHARAPMPCTFPDFVMHSKDAFDMGWFDERYEEELRIIRMSRGGH